jgi:hypothetical protein
MYTWLGDLRLNSYSAIVEPLEGHCFIYVVSDHIKGATPVTNGSRDHAGRLVDYRSSDQVGLITSNQVD